MLAHRLSNGILCPVHRDADCARGGVVHQWGPIGAFAANFRELVCNAGDPGVLGWASSCSLDRTLSDQGPNKAELLDPDREGLPTDFEQLVESETISDVGVRDLQAGAGMYA